LLAVICNQSVQWRRSHPEFRSFAREIGEWLKKIYALYRCNSIRSKSLLCLTWFVEDVLIL
jgi:hypothetical protein